MRAAVVIVEDGRVALIERVREGHTYFKFPGGGSRVARVRSRPPCARRTKSWALA